VTQSTPGTPWQVPEHLPRQQPAFDQLQGDRAHGIILTGEGGSGKSTLAWRLAQRHTDTPVILRGTDVAADVPYAALHATLADQPADVLGNPLAMTHALREVIAAAAGSQGISVIVCDNAHLLDDATAYVLAQLGTPRYKVVVVAPTLTDVPQPLLEPWRDGRFTTFDLPAVASDELAEALARHLGAPVAMAAVHVIGEAAHWNPLFVQYVVAELVETRALEQHDGIWVVARPTRIASQRVVELLGARIDRWSPGRRRVLEALALTDGLQPQMIEQLTDPGDIAALLADGTLEASGAPAPVIRIRQRLVAELVRARITITARRQWRAAVTSLGIDTLVSTPEGLLAFALWSLDSGSGLEPELAISAAQVANNRYEPELAQRLAASVDDPHLKVAASIEASRAWRAQGHHTNALAVLQRSREALSSSPAQVGQFALEYARACIHTPDALPDAVDLVDSCRRDLERGGPTDQAEYVDVAEWELLLVDLRLDELIERLITSRSNARPALRLGSAPASVQAHEQSDRRWLLATCYLAGALTVQGRLMDAARVVDELAHAPVQPSLDLTDGLPVLFEGLLLAGDYSRALALVPAPDALQPWQGVYVGGAIDTALGTLQLLAGRPADALPHLLSGLGQWLVVDNMSALGQAHEVVAMCRAELGQNEQAARHLRAAEHAVRGPRHLVLMSDYFRFRARLLLEGPAAVADELDACIEGHRRSGRYMQALWLLVLGARAGNERHLRELAEGLVPQPAGMVRAIGRWATALLARDAQALLDAASDLAVCGNGALAQEAADLALSLESSDATAARAKAVLATVGRSPADLDVTSGLALLTPREQDVARLASAGLTNRDIAARLYLSLRTVESYLSNAFAKLGISGRKELASLM
jgi:DNA-binding CsgD family transcriptional regulator